MRDLVETVIDNLLAQERRLQTTKRASAASRSQFRETLNAVNSQTEKNSTPAIKAQHHKHQNQQLWQASLQFEGLFIQQMMAAMRKSVPKSGFLPHGFAQDVQGSMMDQAVAETASKRGEFGIAEAIYRQMNRNSTPIQENPDIADKKIMDDPIHKLSAAAEVDKHAR